MFAINADYVMMIDSDMTFPSDTVDRLLAHDKDIVGATYVRRGPPFDNLGETLNATGDIQSGLVEMKRIPTGMLLIRAEVFKRLRRPYFRFGIDEIHGANIGEDCTFSDMVRDLDYQIWCDVDLSKEIGHLHQYALTVEDPSVRAISARYQEEMRATANG